MFIKTETETKLDTEIQSVLEELGKHEKTSDEYEALVERMTKLHKLKTEERYSKVNPDTMLVVGANIFGILWLARYERENVIRSKTALGFVMKPRA